MNEVTPPQNLAAEENVLGAMLLSPRAIEEASELLDAGDFYRESNGLIFRAACDMHAASQPVEPLTLAAYLDQTKQLARVGGQSKIAELAASTPSASNVSHYARIVANEAGRRALMGAGQKIVSSVVAGGDIEDLIAQAEAHLSAATTLRNNAAVLPITDELPDYRSELLHAYQTKTPMFGKRTGYPDLDNILLGFWPGQLVILAARPSQGKSALALNIAENFVDAGIPVLFSSMEMSRRELLIRSLARAAKIDGKRLMTGMIREEDTASLKKGIEKVTARTALFVEDAGDMTLPSLRAIATRLHRQQHVGLIVVDYLQLMSGPERETNDRVAAITRGLKQLSMKLGIPILALSQMNRAIETRSDKRPQLSDLRDSGAIEQDADTVLFLHDESAYEAGKEADGTVECIVAKNRKGERSSVKLLFLKRFQTFQTPSRLPAGATDATN